MVIITGIIFIPTFLITVAMVARYEQDIHNVSHYKRIRNTVFTITKHVIFKVRVIE